MNRLKILISYLQQKSDEFFQKLISELKFSLISFENFQQLRERQIQKNEQFIRQQNSLNIFSKFFISYIRQKNDIIAFQNLINELIRRLNLFKKNFDENINLYLTNNLLMRMINNDKNQNFNQQIKFNDWNKIEQINEFNSSNLLME